MLLPPSLVRHGLAAALLVLPGAAAGGEPPAASGRQPAIYAPERIESASALSEVRLGVMAHDPWSPERGSLDVNGEFVLKKLFRSADPLLDALIPRLHIGGTLNTNGRTSNAYAGLTWTFDVTKTVFVEAAFGGALNNGSTGAYWSARRNPLGCRESFREAASIGWRFAPGWAAMVTVEHFSNAGLCSQNRGVTNLGARLSYSF